MRRWAALLAALAAALSLLSISAQAKRLSTEVKEYLLSEVGGQS